MEDLCRKSFEINENRSNVIVALKTSVGTFFNKMINSINKKRYPGIRIKTALSH
ncbi:MAG: hypothetical protein ACM31E_09110 [Fibrobacterota bacterium]